MRRTPFALVLGAFALSGCSSIVLESHTSADAGRIAFARTVVAVSVPVEEDSESARRLGENELVSQLAELNASPSYRLISSEDIKSPGRIREWAAGEGFDGLVSVWLERVSVQHLDSLGADPAFEFDEVPTRDWVTLRAHAEVVSLRDNREYWTGTVELSNPYSLTQNLPVLVRAVMRKLKAERLAE